MATTKTTKGIELKDEEDKLKYKIYAYFVLKWGRCEIHVETIEVDERKEIQARIRKLRRELLALDEVTNVIQIFGKKVKK